MKSETSALTWVLGLLVVLFAGIAFFYYNKQPVRALPSAPSYVKLEEVTTQIGSEFFVRATVAVEVGNKDAEKQVSDLKVTLRGLATRTLTNATEQQLFGSEGRRTLRRAMLKNFNEALGGKVVGDVLFTDFIVGFG